MNWLEKYTPLFLKDLKSNKDEVEKAIKWINEYKKDSTKSKKVLFIGGAVGSGKTNLANMIFKEYGYDKIELNSGDIRSQKKIGDFLRKALTYKNVIDMFHDGNRPVGILIDEIDTICKLADKGGFTEFLGILKMNDKYESMNSSTSKKKKVVIDIKDYIKLYNPIICTSNEINDKKINELKKYSEVVTLNKPNDTEMALIIDEIYNNVGQSIDKQTKVAVCNSAQYDIRRLIILLEDLHVFAKGKTINNKLFEEYKKIYKEKDEDIQLFDSTRFLLSKKMTIPMAQKYFEIDCLLTPLMIYHNSIDYIKNSDNNNKEKLGTYKNILNSLCIQDTIQTNIFENQDWDELYDISSIYGAVIPNYYSCQLSCKKNKTEIQFTSLLNKISQMFVNKKLLNGAKYSLGKINFDTDEIIYLTEIISLLFEKYQDELKLEGEGEGDDDCGDGDDEKEVINNSDNNNIIINEKPLENNSKLVALLNKYNISVENLENILKIEKLNMNDDKKKKKMTLRVKKELSKFLHIT